MHRKFCFILLYWTGVQARSRGQFQKLFLPNAYLLHTTPNFFTTNKLGVECKELGKPVYEIDPRPNKRSIKKLNFNIK